MTPSVEKSGGVPSPLFHSCKLHQRGDGLAFVGVWLDQHLPPEAYPAPFAHEAGTAEEIALHAQPIEAAHVARKIDPPHLKIGREYF